MIELLLQTRKESLLSRLRKVFEEEQTDWWEDMTSEEQESIKTGITQAGNGEYVEHKVVMERFKKRH